MPITPADIASLKQRIKSDLDALEETRTRLQLEFEAATLLEKRLQNEKAERQLEIEIPTVQTAGEPTVSFAESVRRAIAQFEDKTFTVRDVENMLRALNAQLPQHNLRARIAGEIKGEIGRKNVLLVKKGSGHVPHTYRRVLETPKNERAPVIQPRAPSTQH